jgi:uncharacterized membrane protein
VSENVEPVGGVSAASAERRWPVTLAVLVAVALQVGTPTTGRVGIWWVFPVSELVVLVLLNVADPGRIDDRTARVRRITIVLIVLMTAWTIGGVAYLLFEILTRGPDYNATTLLGRGGALWGTNVIVFSLWYWELDRGGPAERAARSGVRPSFAFPEDATPEVAPVGWSAKYPDYLYLSFTNSTAFSPTDTLPVQTWAKMTLMMQSALQLLTAVLVIARAINVLPG